MAYQTGMCNNPLDLLALFRTFITSHADLLDPAGNGSLPSQAWAELKYGVVGLETELYLRGPGNNNDQAVYCNTTIVQDITAGTDAWSWETRGATAFNTAQTFDTQPGICSNPKVMPLQDTPSQYWFFANGRRYIIVDQVTASVYTNTYAGLIRPFEPVSNVLEYPYPLYVGASMGRRGLRFSDVSAGYHRSFWNPGYDTDQRGSGSMFSAGNIWRGISNYDSSGGSDVTGLPTGAEVGLTMPYSHALGSESYEPENMEPLLDGTYLLTEVEVAWGDANWLLYKERYGVLDGVAHLSGISQAVTNQVTIGADTYIVFQEAFRTGPGDYAAIKI